MFAIGPGRSGADRPRLVSESFLAGDAARVGEHGEVGEPRPIVGSRVVAERVGVRGEPRVSLLGPCGARAREHVDRWIGVGAGAHRGDHLVADQAGVIREFSPGGLGCVKIYAPESARDVGFVLASLAGKDEDRAADGLCAPEGARRGEWREVFEENLAGRFIPPHEEGRVVHRGGVRASDDDHASGDRGALGVGQRPRQ